MYIAIIIFVFIIQLSQSDAKCVWTECQMLNDEACKSYSATSWGFQSCGGQVKYLCCTENNAIIQQEPQQLIQLPKQIQLPDMPFTKAVAVVDENCAWSSCQPDIWAAKGCELQGKVERLKFPCTDGHRYFCCSPPPRMQPAPIVEDCWWTGCQLNTWAIVGCAQYNRLETSRRYCAGGIEYNCCTPGALPSQVSSPQTSHLIQNNCSWTKCQSTQTGCELNGGKATSRRICKGGNKIQCCTTLSPSEDCFWTECQLFTWFVRGCAHYGREVTQSKNCQNGQQFQCCLPKSSVSQKLVNFDTCTWTECQEFTWAVRGCAYLGKKPVSSRSCPRGEQFQCC